MKVTDYDLGLLQLRVREVCDQYAKLRRQLDELINQVARLEKQCQVRSSSSQESATPTLPASN